MRLNHRGLLGALLGAAGVTPAQQGDALTALDKLDKIGLGGVVAELEAREESPSMPGSGVSSSFRAPGERPF